MKGLDRAARIVTKILEISNWVGAALMAAVCICCLAAPEQLRYFMDVPALRAERAIEVYGFEMAAADTAGEVSLRALLLFSLTAVVLFSLAAMIFRNLYLIIRRSETGSPFQPDNIRMLREIGLFAVAIPLAGLTMSGILRLALGVDAVETSVSLDGFVMGLVVLCLTRFFVRGAELERDVDGLV